MALSVDAVVMIEAPVPPEITEDTVDDLLTAGFGAAGATGEWAVEVLLTTDDLVQDLHARFMGDDAPTDILTFADEPVPGAPAGSGAGQIVISVEQAARQADDYGQTLADELRFLVLHGVLHLCGWDDDTDEKRATMLARQHELLATIGRR